MSLLKILSTYVTSRLPVFVAVFVSLSLFVFIPPVASAIPPVAEAVPPVAVTITVTLLPAPVPEFVKVLL